MADNTPDDLELIRSSHLSYLRFWDGVEPTRHRRRKNATKLARDFPWQQKGEDACPISPKPIASLVEIPEAGEYRVYLHYALDKSFRLSPVQLTMTRQRIRKGDGDGEETYVPARGAAIKHAFGNIRLLRGVSGAELEETLPVRFGREADRVGSPARGVYLWEYQDMPLKAGVYRVELTSIAKNARVRAFFMTRSKDFSPSLSGFVEENKLSRLYMRFRVVDSSGGVDRHTISANLTFQCPSGKGG